MNFQMKDLKIDVSKAQSILKLSSTIFLIIILLGLMFTVANQQNTIRVNELVRVEQTELIKKQVAEIAMVSQEQNEYIEFIQAGARFTYNDGKALFYLINNCDNEITHEGLLEIYGDDDTQFGRWLFQQRQCIE